MENVASVNKIGVLGLESALLAMALVLLALLISYLIFRQDKGRWESFWDFLEHHLTPFFAVVWVTGFCVYLVGTSLTADNATYSEQVLCLLCQAPMAFVHTFQMFILMSDVSAIQDEFYRSLFFMTCFSLVHFLAAMVSMMLIIKYFGYNMVAKLRLWCARRFGKSPDELYVFWGMNEATYCLAKDINKQYAEGRKSDSYRIIVVNTAEDDTVEEDREHSAVERLSSFISFNSEELNRYQELGCLTINLFSSLAKVKMTDGAERSDILAGKMNSTPLAKMINKTGRKAHIFFLGEDEGENVVCTAVISRDTTIDRFAKSGKKVTIYCKGRYDYVNRVVEDKYSEGNVEVKVVDSSFESINLLRSVSEYHPVNYVEMDREKEYGTVKSGFCSLVIGFGETGRDAARFLYEYGAFVDGKTGKRSAFRCHIVDKEADKTGGLFFVHSPSVVNLEPLKADIHSPEFYGVLDEVSKELNYVVIALEDDLLNIETAVHLFNHIRKKRADMGRFKIMVRCHDSKLKGHLQQIADHYNEQWCGEVRSEYITIFGTEEQLYTYDHIIENSFAGEGRQYNAMYCEASGGKMLWEERHKTLLQRRSLDSLEELRRKECMDVANAYHALTKRAILRSVTENEDGTVREEFRHIHECLEGKREAPRFIKRNMGEDGKIRGEIKAEGDYTEEEQRLFLNLARLEHERWNAAHELLGYQSYAKGDGEKELVKDERKRHTCSERFRLHNCMVDWDELDDEMNDEFNEGHPDYKLYDYMVVTATLMMSD